MKKIKFTKEFKIKTIVLGCMLILLLLSFFFSSNIDNLLNLKAIYLKHQTSIQNLNSDFKVNYLNVGQGSSTFIEFPDGKTALIDAGDALSGEVVAKFIQRGGYQTIDYLIATHADSDHIGGFNYILRNFEVKNIYRPFQIAGTGTSSDSFVVYEDEDLKPVYEYYCFKTNRTRISRVTSSIYKEFISNIYSEQYEENGSIFNSQVTVFYDGLEIVGTNYKIRFFAPDIRDEELDLSEYCSTFGYATKGYGVNESNSNSAIFLVTIQNEKFFFSGDAPWSSGSKDKKNYEEEDFVNTLEQDEIQLLSNVSVYLVGHHGSSYSSGYSLLNLITPKFSVISVGEINNYGHPSEQTLFRLARTKGRASDYLLRTDENGNIVFGLENGELKYSLEYSENITSYIISWYELGTMLFILVSMLVIFAKPINRKKY